jgi:hypothetical protein
MTTNDSTQSAMYFNPFPKLPPIFFLLLFSGFTLALYAYIKHVRVVAQKNKTMFPP